MVEILQPVIGSAGGCVGGSSSASPATVNEGGGPEPVRMRGTPVVSHVSLFSSSATGFQIPGTNQITVAWSGWVAAVREGRLSQA